jgi:serine/threonine-protein kinase HipA
MKERVRAPVVIGEQRRLVGELIFESDGPRQSSMFRYATEWLERPNRFALAPTMPLTQAPIFASGSRENRRGALPGPITDGAPDSWGRGLIRKALGRQPTEIEFLLHADDRTRQGALRYLDAAGEPVSQDAPPVPRITDLDQLARLARLYERDPDLGLKELRRLVADAGSLGGARPKANLDDDGTLAIAKFTSERDTMPIERMEVATLRLARAAGINAASARIELGGTDYPVAVIARFDRRRGGRVHYLSAQSFMGLEEAAGGFYADLADVMRAHCADHRAQLEELHRRIMFTILVSNNDDHLKNHGFLYAGEGKWALAPAFDVNPQPERHRQLETGISELSGFEASIEAAIEAAPFFDLKEDHARANLGELVTVIRDQWQGHCRDAGMSGSEIAAYRAAFEHAEFETALRMSAPRVPARPTSGASP